MPSELRNRVAADRDRGREHRPARCCCSTSAGAAARSASSRRASTAAASRCSARPIISNARSARSAKSAAAASTDLLKRELAVLISADAGAGFAGGRSGDRKWIEGGGCCCALPGRISPSRATICCRCGCAAAAARSAARCPGRQPAKLAPFDADSPFAGLAIPADVTVSRQVLAEPDLDLAGKTWARLADGTPLVTAEKRGQGLDRAGAHHGQCRMVEPRAVRPVRRDAAADRRDEPGRRRQPATRRCRRSRRSTASAGCSARRPTRATDRRRRDSPTRDRLAAATRPASTARPTRAARSTCRPAVNELKPIGDLPAEASRARASRAGREVDFRPPLLTAALVLGACSIC